MKGKRLILTGTLISSILVLSACNMFDSNGEGDTSETASQSSVVVTETTASENSIIIKNSQELFNKMLNLSKLKSEEAKHDVITAALYDPAAYYKSLTDANTIIPTENFYKMSAAHSDAKVEKIGPNHYYYKSLVTVEKQKEISSKPEVGRSYLSMELKEQNGVLKIVRLKLEH